jgi:hypothetical protein
MGIDPIYRPKGRFRMDWIVVAKCDECSQEKSYEVSGNTVPYSIGDAIEQCNCGGQFIVDEILEVG